MAKSKTVFVCQECGYESPGWLGKCPACLEWNTLIEEPVIAAVKGKKHKQAASKALTINEIKFDEEERASTGIKEMDRVLGGGLVKGSLILVGGDPGIGKSTILLQVCQNLQSKDKILYISGEESISQIKLRAERLKVTRDKLFIVSATELDEITALLDEVKPGLLIIDSIQTMYSDDIPSAPGSVSQVREVTARLVRIAKSTDVTVFIVGHVTKEGAIAGPRVLEHMVDTVLYFEGERHMSFRILRAVKNRFGSTNEIGIFEMRESGLIEVENPSVAMLMGRPENAPGSVIVSSIEGTRPMLIEIQALVSVSGFGTPRRMTTGVDHNRVAMLMAVLEKRTGLLLNNYDAYVNVVGGIKIDEPACDLGIAVAIASSFKNVAVDPGLIFIGEVGLAGEIRAVSQVEKRIAEAIRVGFKGCVMSKDNMKSIGRLNIQEDFQIKTATSVTDVLDMLF
jgi:DNA repair protein RadA/Sms